MSSDLDTNPSPTQARPPQSINPVTATILLIAGVAGIVIATNYHIVPEAPGILVKRTSIGFDDMFASVSDCTSGPKFMVMSLHPSLCNALLRDGVIYFETDEGR